MGITVKNDKIGLILFNNTETTKTILLQINLTKLKVLLKLNSKIRNKENMSLAIYEILTADYLPRTKYDINNLALFMDVLFSMDVNYLNIMINDFEPLVERFNMGVTMMQVAPFSKMKGYITTNDIINLNLSTDSVIALNKFLTTFLQDEKIWEENKVDQILFAPIESSHGSKGDNVIEEVILKFINITGINLIFYFDDNPNYKIPLKNQGKISFTRSTLYKARGHDRHRNPYQKTTFSLCVGDCQPIENINFQRNNYKNFKTFLQNNNGNKYPVYFSVKVETLGIMDIVTFCPSLSFYNDTKFDTIFLLINNPNIVENTIIIPKEQKGYVPLSWLMCDYPESTISIKLSQNGQSTQICSNALELFSNPIIEEHILEERKSKKKEVQKAVPNANNPTFIKMVDIKKSECENRKDSKTIIVNDNGINKSINLDYFILQSKDLKKLK
jgi:hypothetical protein